MRIAQPIEMASFLGRAMPVTVAPDLAIQTAVSVVRSGFLTEPATPNIESVCPARCEEKVDSYRRMASANVDGSGQSTP